jgi:hypothetical protein
MSREAREQEQAGVGPEQEGPRPGRGRRAAFLVVVVLFAIIHLLMTPLPFLVLAFFIKSNPSGISHQVHELSFGALFAISFVGLLSQLRRPERKLAGMYQVLIVVYVTLLLSVVVDRLFDPIVLIFLVMPLVLVWLHPARDQLLRPGWSPSVLLVTAAGIAAVPLVVFAADQLVTGWRAQSEGGDIIESVPEDLEGAKWERRVLAELAEAGIPKARRVEVLHSGHWVGMGAFALSIAGLSLLGATRPRGWRLLVWSSSAALCVYALASLRYSSDASAMPGIWAVLAIAWSVLFVVLSERDEMDVARPEGATT